MKRSEMIEIIQEYLAGHLNYQTMPIIVASEMLARLEEAGMLPPECEDWMNLEECRKFYGEDYEPGDIWSQPRKNVNRWESEE